MEGTEVESSAGDRGCGVAGVVEWDATEQFVDGAGLDDDDFSGLTDSVDSAIDADRRSAVVASDSFGPDISAAGQLDAVEDSFIVPFVEMILVDDRSGDIGQVSFTSPDGVSTGVDGTLQHSVSSSLSTAGDDESIGVDGRGNGSEREGFGGPVLSAGVGIEAADA